MQLSSLQKFPYLLVLGDVFVLVIVTVIGFSTHERLSAGIPRLLSTFVPLMVSWGLIGVHVGVFDPTRITDPRQLWRPLWAMILAGPFAGWMRALWLGTAVAPIFVVVLGGVSALSLLAWRVLYLFLDQKLSR